MPETNIEEYLDCTIERLSKKYDEFKNRYCEVNHITASEHRVKDEQGEVAYTKV